MAQSLYDLRLWYDKGDIIVQTGHHSACVHSDMLFKSPVFRDLVSRRPLDGETRGGCVVITMEDVAQPDAIQILLIYIFDAIRCVLAGTHRSLSPR